MILYLQNAISIFSISVEGIHILTVKKWNLELSTVIACGVWFINMISKFVPRRLEWEDGVSMDILH